MAEGVLGRYYRLIGDEGMRREEALAKARAEQTATRHVPKVVGNEFQFRVAGDQFEVARLSLGLWRLRCVNDRRCRYGDYQQILADIAHVLDYGRMP